MKKIRTWFRTPAVSIAALLVAIGLLIFAGVGGAQAALNARSSEYLANISLNEIGVTLLENGTAVANRDYNSAAKDGSWTGKTTGKLTLSGISEKGADGKEKALVLNKKYDEVLTVQNSRTVGEYVRVSIYRYWVDENDKKQTDLDPTLIKLYLNGTDLDTASSVGGWTVDTDPTASTVLQQTPGERLVMYYNAPLASGEVTNAFLDQVAISNEIATMVENSGGTVGYQYNGKKFCIDVVVDAVQDHHVDEAMKSAWGVSFQGGGSNDASQGDEVEPVDNVEPDDNGEGGSNNGNNQNP